MKVRSDNTQVRDASLLWGSGGVLVALFRYMFLLRKESTKEKKLFMAELLEHRLNQATLDNVEHIDENCEKPSRAREVCSSYFMSEDIGMACVCIMKMLIDPPKK
jgi:hypothetical protein